MLHTRGNTTPIAAFPSSHPSNWRRSPHHHHRRHNATTTAAVPPHHHHHLLPTPVTSTIEAQPIAELAHAASSIAVSSPSPPLPTPTYPLPTPALVLGGLVLAGYGIKKIFDTPSRTYDANVGEEYDAWTEEGVLEYYWGEHIHLGHYTPEERRVGYKKKNFIQAKYDFIDEMFSWAGPSPAPATILDVGCGIGGTSRYLATKLPEASVTGITLSPSQVRRATELAQDRAIDNVKFTVMDALHMDFPDNSFDLVWACESGEHMPDKGAYVNEMIRVLKPGGTLVVATWCQREETSNAPFSEDDKRRLKFLYDEWAHPFFVSKEEYGRLTVGSGKMKEVVVSDWTAPTVASWRHSNWVGVWDPWIVVFKGPRIWYKTLREIVTLERMHRAFTDGLMEYGMLKAVKAKEGERGDGFNIEVAE